MTRKPPVRHQVRTYKRKTGKVVQAHSKGSGSKTYLRKLKPVVRMGASPKNLKLEHGMRTVKMNIGNGRIRLLEIPVGLYDHIHKLNPESWVVGNYVLHKDFEAPVRIVKILRQNQIYDETFGISGVTVKARDGNTYNLWFDTETLRIDNRVGSGFEKIVGVMDPKTYEHNVRFTRKSERTQGVR